MGSSLTVTPAADIPKDVAKKGRLIIVNLQSTPLDKLAYMRINGMCDDVMRRLAATMQLKVREFILRRLINFKVNNKTNTLEFRGVDQRGVPFTFFKAVSVKHGVNGNGDPLKGEPYRLSMDKVKGAKLNIQFYRYLGEPDLSIQLDAKSVGNFLIEYDPRQGEWVRREWVLEAKEHEKEEK